MTCQVMIHVGYNDKVLHVFTLFILRVYSFYCKCVTFASVLLLQVLFYCACLPLYECYFCKCCSIAVTREWSVRTSCDDGAMVMREEQHNADTHSCIVSVHCNVQHCNVSLFRSLYICSATCHINVGTNLLYYLPHQCCTNLLYYLPHPLPELSCVHVPAPSSSALQAPAPASHPLALHWAWM